MKLSEKVLLKPSKETLNVLWQISEASRKLYNLLLQQRNYAYRLRVKSPSMFQQKKEVTELNHIYPDFKILYSLQRQEVVRQLEQNFNSFYEHYKSDKTARLPRFKSHKYFFTLRYVQSGFNVDFKTRLLTLNYGNRNQLQIPFTSHRPEIFERIKNIKAVTIFQDKVNKLFYASINYEIPEPEFIDNGIVAGNDPGVINFVTQARSDGKIRIYKSTTVKRITKYFDKQIDKVKSKRDKCHKGSRRWNYLNAIINKLYHRRKEQIKQQLYLIAKDANSASYNAIGKFNKKDVISDDPKKGKGNQYINRVVQNNWPIAKYIQISTYKSAFEGHKSFPVDETGSTRTCCKCNYIFPDHLDPSIRIFECPKCGLKIPRDINSSIIDLNKTLADLARPVMTPEQFHNCTVIHFTLSGKRIAETHPVTQGCPSIY